MLVSAVEAGESELVVQANLQGEGPVVRVKDGKLGDVRGLLEEATRAVQATRREVRVRAPETHPDEYLLVQRMLDTLVNEGSVSFWDFTRSGQAWNEFERVSTSFEPAMRLFLSQVGLPIPSE